MRQVVCFCRNCRAPMAPRALECDNCGADHKFVSRIGGEFDSRDMQYWAATLGVSADDFPIGSPEHTIETLRLLGPLGSFTDDRLAGFKHTLAVNVKVFGLEPVIDLIAGIVEEEGEKKHKNMAKRLRRAARCWRQ
jgi:hypothetical protein